MLRQASPADGCKASKEDLIDDGFGATKDCPNCKDDWNVLCRVANHPLRQSTGNFFYFFLKSIHDVVPILEKVINPILFSHRSRSNFKERFA